MSEIYENYIKLETQLLALQDANPDDVYNEYEEDIADQLAYMWYKLDESERIELKKLHKLRFQSKLKSIKK